VTVYGGLVRDWLLHGRRHLRGDVRGEEGVGRGSGRLSRGSWSEVAATVDRPLSKSCVSGRCSWWWAKKSRSNVVCCSCGASPCDGRRCRRCRQTRNTTARPGVSRLCDGSHGSGGAMGGGGQFGWDGPKIHGEERRRSRALSLAATLTGQMCETQA